MSEGVDCPDVPSGGLSAVARRPGREEGELLMQVSFRTREREIRKQKSRWIRVGMF